MKKNQKLTYEKLSPKQKELIEKLRTIPAFKGFTLTELLCVLAIIGIVAAISVPSITRYVKNAKEKACDKSMDALEAEIKSLVGSRRFFNDEDLSDAVDKLVEKYSNTPLVDKDSPVEFVNEIEGTIVEARCAEICPNDGTCEVEWRIKATDDEYVKEFDFICDCDCHEEKEIDLKNIKVRIFEDIQVTGDGNARFEEEKIKMVTEDIIDDIELNDEVSSKVYGYTKNISGMIEWMSYDYKDEEGKEYCIIYRMNDADNNGKIETSEKSISVMNPDHDVKAEGTLGSTVYLKNFEENKYDTVMLKNLSDSEICWVQRDSDWYVESWERYPYISNDETYVISTRNLENLSIEAKKESDGYSYTLTAGYSDGYRNELNMITKDDIKKTENNGSETWYLNNGYVVFESEKDLQKYLDSNWTYPENNYDSSKKTDLENIIKNQDRILEKFESDDEKQRIDKIFFAYQETVKKVSTENPDLVETKTVTKYGEIKRKFEDSVKVVYEDGEYKVTRPYYIGGGSLIENNGILTYVPNINAGSEVRYDSGTMLLDRYSESDGKDNCFTYPSNTSGKITEENALKQLVQGKTESVYSCSFTDSESHEGRYTEDEALEKILNGSLDAVQACVEEISVVCKADSTEILEKFETGTKNSEYIFIDPEDPEKILSYEEAAEKIGEGTELLVLEDKKIYSSTVLSSQLKIKNEIDEETVSVWLNKGKDDPKTEDYKEMYTVSGKRQLILTEGTSITLTGDPVESDFIPYDDEIGKGYYFSIDGDDRKLTEEEAYEILIESGISYNKAEVFYEENGKQYSAGIMAYEFSDNAELIGKDNGSKQYSVQAQFAVEGYNSAGVLVDSLPCGYFDVPEFDPSNTDWTGTDKKGGYYYFAKTPVSVERLSETEVKEIFREEDNLLDGHLTEINAYYINFDSDAQSDPVFAGRLILEFADHADLLEDTNTSNDKDYCAKADFTIKGYNKTDSEALDSTDSFSLFVPEYSRDDKKPTGYFFAENTNTISRYTEKEILAKFKDGSVSEINAYYKSEDVNADIAYAGKIVSEYSGSAVLDIVSDKYIVKAGFEPVGYNSKNEKLHTGELTFFAAAESTADNTKGYYFKADDSTKYSYADAAKMLTGFECDAITAYYSNGSGEPTTVTPSIKRFFKSTARVVRNSDGTFGVEGLFSLKADTLETSADWYSVPEYDSKTGRGFYFTVPSAPEKYLSSEEAYKLLESGKNAVLDVYYKDSENKDPVKAGTVKSVFTDAARVVKENDDKTAENYKVQGEFKLNAYDISGELTDEDNSPKYYDVPKWDSKEQVGYYYNPVFGESRLTEAAAFELINDGKEKKIDICVIAGKGCAQKEAGSIETAFTEKARLTVNTKDGEVTGYGAEGEYAVTVVSKAGTGTSVIDTLGERYIPGEFSTEKTGYYYSDSRTEKMNWTDALADLESLDVDKVTVIYYDSVSGRTAEAGTIELEYCENAKLVKGDDYKVEAEFCTVGKIGSEKIEDSEGEKKYIDVDPYDSNTGKGYYFGDEGAHLTEAAAKEKLYKFDQKTIDVYYSDNSEKDTKAGTLSRVYEDKAKLVLDDGHFVVDGDFHITGKAADSSEEIKTEKETVRVPKYTEKSSEGYYFTAGGNDKLDEKAALEKLKNFECDEVKVFYKDTDSANATELSEEIKRIFTGNAQIVETEDGKYAVQGEFVIGFGDEKTAPSWLDVPAYSAAKDTGYYFTLSNDETKEKLTSDDVKKLLESGKNVEIEAWYKDSAEDSAVKAGTLKSIFTDNAKAVKDTDEKTPENYKVQGEFKINIYDTEGKLTKEDTEPKYYDIPKWVEGGDAGYYYNPVFGESRLTEAAAFELINDGKEKKIDICVIAGKGCAQKEAGSIETAFTEKARLTVNTKDGEVTGYGAEGEYAVTVVSKAGTGTTVIDTLGEQYIPGEFSTEKTGYYYSDSKTEKMNWTDALADLESLDVDKVTVIYYDSVSGKTAEAGTIELEYCENAKLVKGDDYKVEAEFCTVGKIGSEKIEGSDGEKKYIAVDPYDSNTGKGYYFGDEGDHLTEAAAKEKLYKFDQKTIDVYYSDNGKDDTKAGTLSRVYEGEAELVLENGHFAVDGDFHVSGKAGESGEPVNTKSETVRVPEYNESKDEGYYFTAGGNDKLDEETALEKLKNFECDKVKVYYKDIDSSEATELETVITRKFTGNAKIVETPDGKYAVQGEFTLGFDDEQTSSSWLDVPAYKTDKSSDDDTGTGYYFTLKGETEKLNSEDVKKLLESGKNVEIDAWYKDSTEKNSAVKAGTLKSIFTDNAKVVKDTDENTPENYKVQGEFKINVYDSDGELASEDTDPKYYDVPKWTEDGDAGYYYNTVGGSKRLNEEEAFKLINDGKEKTVDICVIAGEICGQQKVGQISADFTGNARLVFDESGSGDDYSFSYMAEGEYEVTVISGTGTAESVVENLGKKYLPAAYKTDDTGYYFETDGKKTSWREAYDKLKNQSASETVAHFYDSESNSDVIAGTVKMEFAGDAELVKGNDFAVNALYYPAGHSTGSGEILGNVDETAQYLPAKIYSSTDHNGYYFGDHINEAAAEEKLNSFEADSFDVKYDDNELVTADAGTISRKYNGNASVEIEQNKFVISGSFKTVGKDGSTVVSESDSQDLLIPQIGTKLSSAGSYYKTSESGEILTEAQMENSLKSFEARSASAYYLDSDGTVYDIEPDIERIFTGNTKLIEKDDGTLTVQGQFMLQAGSVSTDPEYLNVPKYNSDTQTGYYFTLSSDDDSILTEEQAMAMLGQNVTLNIWYKDGKNAAPVKVGYISREFTGKAKTVEAPAGSDHRYEVAAEYQTVVFDSGNNKTITENDKKYEIVPMWDESNGYGYYFVDKSGKKISEADTFDSLDINYGTTVKIEYVNQKDETPVLAGTVSSEFTGLVELVCRSAPSEPLEMAVNGNYAIVVRTKNSDTDEDRLGMSTAKDKQGVFSTSQTGYYFIDSKGEKAEWSKVFDELKEGTLTEAKGYYYDKASGRTEYAGSVQLTSYRYEISGTKDIGVAEKYTALIKTADPAGPEKPYNVCINVEPYTEETGEGYYLWDNSTNKIIPGTLKEALEAVAAGTYSDVSVYCHSGSGAISVSADSYAGKLTLGDTFLTDTVQLKDENGSYVLYDKVKTEYGYQNEGGALVVLGYLENFEKQSPFSTDTNSGYYFKYNTTKYTYSDAVEMMKSGEASAFNVRCDGKDTDHVTKTFGDGTMKAEETGLLAEYKGSSVEFDISQLIVTASFNVDFTEPGNHDYDIESMFTFDRTLSHSENGSDGYTISYNGLSDEETIKLLTSGKFEGTVEVTYKGKTASVELNIDPSYDLRIAKDDDGNYIVQGKYELGTEEEPWFDLPVYSETSDSGYYFTENGGTEKLTSDDVNDILKSGGNVVIEVMYKDEDAEEAVSVGTVKREFTGKAKTVRAPENADHKYEVVGEYQTVVYDAGGNVVIPAENAAYENVPKWKDSNEYGYYFLNDQNEKISESDALERVDVKYGTTVQIMMVNAKNEKPVEAGTVASEFTGLINLVNRNADTEQLDMAINGNYAIVVRSKNVDKSEEIIDAASPKYKIGTFSTTDTGYYFTDSSGNKAEWSAVLDELKAGTLEETEGFYYDKQSLNLVSAGFIKLTSYKYEIMGTEDIKIVEKYSAVITSEDGTSSGNRYDVCIDVKPYTEETGEGYYFWDNSTNKLIPGTLEEALAAVAAGTYSDVSVYCHSGSDAISVAADSYVGKLMLGDKFLTQTTRLEKENESESESYVLYDKVKTEYGYQNEGDQFKLLGYLENFEKQSPFSTDTNSGYYFKYNTTKYTYSDAVNMMKSGEASSFNVRCDGKDKDHVTKTFGDGTMKAEETGLTAEYKGRLVEFDISQLIVTASFNVDFTETGSHDYDIESMFTFDRTLSHSENGSDGYTISYNGLSDKETMELLASGQFEGTVEITYKGKTALVDLVIDSSYDLRIAKDDHENYIVQGMYVIEKDKNVWFDIPEYTDETGSGYYFAVTENGVTTVIKSDQLKDILKEGRDLEVNVCFVDSPGKDKVNVGTIKREFTGKAKTVCESDGDGNKLAVMGEYHTVVYDAAGNIIMTGEDPAYVSIPRWDGSQGYYFYTSSGEILNEAEAFDNLKANYGSDLQIMMVNSEGEAPVKAGEIASVFSTLSELENAFDESGELEVSVFGSYYTEVRSENTQAGSAVLVSFTPKYYSGPFTDSNEKTGYYFTDSKGQHADWSTVYSEMKSGVLEETKGYFYDAASKTTSCGGSVSVSPHSFELTGSDDVRVSAKYSVDINSNRQSYFAEPYYIDVDVKPYDETTGKGYYLWDNVKNEVVFGTVDDVLDAFKSEKYSKVSVYYHSGGGELSVTSDKYIGVLKTDRSTLTEVTKLVKENDEYVVYDLVSTPYGYQNDKKNFVKVDAVEKFVKQVPYDFNTKEGYRFLYGGASTSYSYSGAIENFMSGDMTSYKVRCYQPGDAEAYGSGKMEAKKTGLTAVYSGSDEEFDISKLDVTSNYKVSYTDSTNKEYSIDEIFTFQKTLSHSENGSDGYTLSYDGMSDAKTIEMLSSGFFDGDVIVKYGDTSTTVHILINPAIKEFTGNVKLVPVENDDFKVQGEFVLKRGTDPVYLDVPEYDAVTGTGYYFADSADGEKMSLEEVLNIVDRNNDINIWYKDDESTTPVQAGTVKRAFTGNARTTVLENAEVGNMIAVEGEYHTVVYDEKEKPVITGIDAKYESVQKWNDNDGFGYYFLNESNEMISEEQTFEVINEIIGTKVYIMMKDSAGAAPAEAGICKTEVTDGCCYAELDSTYFYDMGVEAEYSISVITNNPEGESNELMCDFDYMLQEYTESDTEPGYNFTDGSGKKVEWRSVYDELEKGTEEKTTGYIHDAAGNTYNLGDIKLLFDKPEMHYTNEINIKRKITIMVAEPGSSDFYEYDSANLVVLPYSNNIGRGYYLWDNDADKVIEGNINSVLEEMWSGKYSNVSVYYHVGDDAFSVSGDEYIGDLIVGKTYLSQEIKLEKENDEYVVYDNTKTKYGFKNDGKEAEYPGYLRKFERQQPYTTSADIGYYFKPDETTPFSYSEAVNMLKSGEVSSFYVKCKGLYEKNDENWVFGTGDMIAEQKEVSASYSGIPSEVFDVHKLNVSALFNVKYASTDVPDYNIDSMFTFTRTLSHSENGSDGYTLSYNGLSDEETMNLLSSGDFEGNVDVKYGGQSVSVKLSIHPEYISVFTGNTKLLSGNDNKPVVKAEYKLQSGSVSKEPEYITVPEYDTATGSGYYFADSANGTKMNYEEVMAELDGNETVDIWYKDVNYSKSVKVGTVKRKFTGKARTVSTNAEVGNKLAVDGEYHTVVYDAAGNVVIAGFDAAYESVPEWNDSDESGYYFFTSSGEKLNEAEAFDNLTANYGTTIQIMMVNSKGESPVTAGTVSSEFANRVYMYSARIEDEPVNMKVCGYYNAIVRTNNSGSTNSKIYDCSLGLNRAVYIDKDTETGFYYTDNNGCRMDWSTALKKMKAGTLGSVNGYYYDNTSHTTFFAGTANFRDYSVWMYKDKDTELCVKENYEIILYSETGSYSYDVYPNYLAVSPYSKEAGEGYYLWDPDTKKVISGTLLSALKDMEDGKYQSVSVYNRIGDSAFDVSADRHIGNLLKENSYHTMYTKLEKENDEYVLYNKVDTEYGYQNIGEAFVFVEKAGKYEKQEPFNGTTGYYFIDPSNHYHTYSKALNLMKSGTYEQFTVRCRDQYKDSSTGKVSLKLLGTGIMKSEFARITASYSGSSGGSDISKLTVNAVFNVAYTDNYPSEYNIPSMLTFERTLAHSENGSEGYTLSYNGKSDAETMALIASGNFEGTVEVSYNGKKASVYIGNQPVSTGAFTGNTKLLSGGSEKLIVQAEFKEGSTTEYKTVSEYDPATGKGYYFAESADSSKKMSYEEALAELDRNETIYILYKDSTASNAAEAGTLRREFAVKARTIVEYDYDGNKYAVEGEYHTVVFDKDGKTVITGIDSDYESVQRWNSSDNFGYYFLTESNEKLNEKQAFDYIDKNIGKSVKIMMADSVMGTQIEAQAGVVASEYTGTPELVSICNESGEFEFAVSGYYTVGVRTNNPPTEFDTLSYSIPQPKIGKYSESDTGYYFIDSSGNKAPWSKVFKEMTAGTLDKAVAYFHDEAAGKTDIGGSVQIKLDELKMYGNDEIKVGRQCTFNLENYHGGYGLTEKGEADFDLEPCTGETDTGYYIWDAGNNRIIPGNITSAIEGMSSGLYSNVSVYYHSGKGSFSVSSDKYIGKLVTGYKGFSQELKLEKENSEYVVYAVKRTEYGYQNDGEATVMLDSTLDRFEKISPYSSSTNKGYYFRDSAKNKYTYSEAVDLLKSGNISSIEVKFNEIYYNNKDGKTYGLGNGSMTTKQTGIAASYPKDDSSFDIQKLNVSAGFSVDYNNSSYKQYNISGMFTFDRTIPHSENGSDGYKLSYNGASDADTVNMLKSENFDGDVTVTYGGQSTSVYIKIKKAVSYDESIMAANDPNGFVFIQNSSGEFEIVGYRGTSEELIIPGKYRGGYWKEVPNKWDNSQFVINNIAYEYVEESPDTVHEVKTVSSLASPTWFSNAKTVVFGEGIEKIPDNFLANNYYIRGLNKLVISDTVKYIGNRAFDNLGNNYELVLGNNIEYIGDGAFQDNTCATGNIVIPNTVTYLGTDAFKNFGSNSQNVGPKPSLNIEGGMYKNGSYTVPANCFQGSGFNNVTIGGNISVIEENAFQYSGNLTGNLTIGASVSNIGKGAFQNTGFNGILTIENVSESSSWFGLVTRSDITVGNDAFVGTNFSKLRCSDKVKNKLESSSEMVGFFQWQKVGPFGNQNLPSYEKI